MRRRVVVPVVALAVFAGMLGAVAGLAGSASAALPAGPLSTTRVTVTSVAPLAASSASMEYDPSNISTVGGYATSSEINVAMGGGTTNQAFSLDFIAPPGKSLQLGTYPGNNPTGPAGQGSMSRASTSVSNVQFTIVDLAYSGATVTRADIRFQVDWSWLGNPGGLSFGELQLGEPEPSTALISSTRSPAWPSEPVGGTAPGLLPIWIRNTAATPATVGSVARTGTNPADFSIAADGCSHTTLAAHAGCQIQVTFTPRSAGPRTATLSLPVGGTSVTITVNGTGSPGVTQLSIASRPGDPIGGGKTFTITDAQSRMFVDGSGPYQFGAAVYTTGGSPWQLLFRPGGSGPIVPGSYDITSSTSRTAPQLFVEGNGYGCGSEAGTATVKQAAFDSFGAPTAFDITFTFTCPGDPGLSGELKYRATDTATPTPPAPPTVFANDQFQRTTTNGLSNAAPQGGLWTTTGTPSDLSVTPGHAGIALKPTQTSGAYLGSVTTTSTDVQTDLTLPTLPAGGNGYYFSLFGRHVSSGKQYAVLVRIANGAVTLTLTKNDGSSTAVNLSTAKTVATAEAGQAIHVRFDTTGTSPTTLQARAWVGTASEPSTWALTTTDNSTGLQTSGHPGFSAYLSSGTTNGTITANLADFQVTGPIT